MKFGPVPVSDALGAILAHSTQAAERPYDMQMSYRIPKGTALTADHIADLQAWDHATVVVAILEPGDMGENEAAGVLGQALIGDSAGLYLSKAATGRVNVFASAAGLACINADVITAFNNINPMITVATVPPHHRMAADGMVATVKIIAYGVPGADVDKAMDVGPVLSLAAPQYVMATLIETQITHAAQDTPVKGRRVMQARLQRLGMQLTARVVVRHDAAALAQAIRDAPGEVVLILTASATSDPADVGPSALRLAGGDVTRFGMPVDPGNLLFLGALGAKPVIGLPGCARSPVLNGADWVLERVVCGVGVTSADIAGMGVGGLLKESPSRVRPRKA